MALQTDEQKMFFILRCSPIKNGEEAEDIILKQNGEVQAMGRTYHFDNVFPSCASNDEIYKTVIAEKMRLILKVMCNCKNVFLTNSMKNLRGKILISKESY
ncbi:hypothetical protein CEXT_563031 [Caerostris extrusa]|uniref:Uncharacterized protein n=1 Tax=Caerostris extrusa TaxID=172846 RepID=A0AAV4XY61_CAEEX|nr:hypothetical protein CEXT_563031 [Caerostris extrusa]